MKLTSLDQLDSISLDQIAQEQREDLDLFIEGLIELKSTFSPILDFTEGRALVSALEGVLTRFIPVEAAVEVTEDTQIDVDAIFNSVPTPTTPAPVAVQTGGNMNAIQTALKGKTYSVSDDLNGDIFHIIEHHLKADADNLSVEELVMALNMCRVVRNGKEARMTKRERCDIYELHPAVTTTTKKATAEALSQLELDLEEKHGKYSTKAKLAKTKYDTSATYGDEWMTEVTTFSGKLTQGVSLADLASANEPQPVDKLSEPQVAIVEAEAGLPIAEVKSSPEKCREVADKLARRVNALEGKAKTTKAESQEIHDKTYTLFTMDEQARQTEEKKAKSPLDRFMGK